MIENQFGSEIKIFRGKIISLKINNPPLGLELRSVSYLIT